MKRITRFLFHFSFLILLFACANNTKKETNTKENTIDKDSHHEHHENETIELNDGNKWLVDTNMIVHIRNMENEITLFEKVEDKNYGHLSEKLRSDIDLLTSNCTMKGKAHDELHKWLLPYIDLVNELSNAENDSQANAYYLKIKASFTEFNHYFQ